MIRYKIYQNQQQKGLNAGKWFARAVSDETFDLAKLAEHMSKHNSPYSGGVIKGVLSDMVDCIKELLLDGKCVKIDDLAIFGVGIRSKAADTLEDFSLEKNITGMRLKARATGNLSTTNLKLDSQLKQLVLVPFLQHIFVHLRKVKLRIFSKSLTHSCLRFYYLQFTI